MGGRNVNRKPRNRTEYLQLRRRWRALLAGFVLILGFMLFFGLLPIRPELYSRLE